MVVDRFGTLYEGREGGLGRGVIGAHAAGYNTGSFGISVMGNFVSVDAPQAAYETLANAIAWKAAIHGFDPLGTTSRTAKGALVRTVTGHRDVGSTSCPGLIGDRLWWIRTAAAERAPSMPATGPGPVPGRPVLRRRAGLRRPPRQRDDRPRDRRPARLPPRPPVTFEPGARARRGDMARAVAMRWACSPPPTGRAGSRTSTAGRRLRLARALHRRPRGRRHRQRVPRPTRSTPRGALRRDQMATFLAKALDLPPVAPTFDDVKNTRSPHYLTIGAIQRQGTGSAPGHGELRPGRHHAP